MTELVPDDLVKLSLGTIVPADVKLLSGDRIARPLDAHRRVLAGRRRRRSRTGSPTTRAAPNVRSDYRSSPARHMGGPQRQPLLRTCTNSADDPAIVNSPHREHRCWQMRAQFEPYCSSLSQNKLLRTTIPFQKQIRIVLSGRKINELSRQLVSTELVVALRRNSVLAWLYD